MSEPQLSPIRITEPVYIACEGAGDTAFLRKLIQHLGFDGFQVEHTNGIDGLYRRLDGLRGHSDRAIISSIVIVADSNDNQERRFMRIQHDLSSSGWTVPAAPFLVERGQPSVSVFLVPGAGRNGNLETLLTEAVLDAQPNLRECLNDLSACAAEPNIWTENKRAKMMLHTCIAVRCEEDPGVALSYVWGKRGNPIPIDSPRFNELADLLRLVSGA